MSFTAPYYYLFLFLTAVVYFNLPARLRTFALLVASYFFYSSFEPRYLAFIFVTTIVSYTSARIMDGSDKTQLRAAALAAALTIELILLGATKYFNPVAEATGWISPLKILVPLGISFYTFQTIGYLFDVFRRTLPAEKNFFRYGVFLSFFPHLLAGPIEPAAHFLPQLKRHPPFDLSAAKLGVLLILLGLFKKLVIADHLGLIVNLVFDEPSGHKGSAVAFSLFLARYQIFCDFSGYTDIALGSANILGIRLTPNFARPFSATSISDYWRRWHISLGQWIRNYIFYPLVSTPVSRIGVHGLVIITFLVLGLWHGGTINYLLYGLWHGLFVVLDGKTRNWRTDFYTRTRLKKHPALLNGLATLLTFLLIVVPPTLFFRSASFSDSRMLLAQMFTEWKMSDLSFAWESIVLRRSLLIGLSAVAALELGAWFFARKKIKTEDWTITQFSACSVILLVTIIVFGHLVSDAKFIYTQF